MNLRVPDGEDYVEFMLFKEPPAADKRGTSHHLALEVPDAAASVAKLSAKPYRSKYSRQIEIRTGINRKRQVNLFDPDGTRTELMEPHTVDEPGPFIAGGRSLRAMARNRSGPEIAIFPRGSPLFPRSAKKVIRLDRIPVAASRIA